MSTTNNSIVPLENHADVDEESNLCHVSLASPSKRCFMRSHSTVTHVVMVDRGRKSSCFKQILLFWVQNKFSWLLLTIPASIFVKAVGWNSQVFILCCFFIKSVSFVFSLNILCMHHESMVHASNIFGVRVYASGM